MNEVFVDQATAEAPVKASLKLGYSHTRDMPTSFYYASGDPWNAWCVCLVHALRSQQGSLLLHVLQLNASGPVKYATCHATTTRIILPGAPVCGVGVKTAAGWL